MNTKKSNLKSFFSYFSQTPWKMSGSNQQVSAMMILFIFVCFFVCLFGFLLVFFSDFIFIYSSVMSRREELEGERG